MTYFWLNIVFSQNLFLHNANISKQIDKERMCAIMTDNEKTGIKKSIAAKLANIIARNESPYINEAVH